MKDKNLFIITIICIVLLSFMSYRQLKEFNKDLSNKQIPELKMPNFELLLFPEEGSNVDFTTPDRRLTISYPKSWVPISEINLTSFNQEIIQQQANILLLTNKFDMKDGTFASLIIQELEGFSSQDTIDDIIQKMIKEKEEEQIKIKIISVEKDDKEAFLNIEYPRDQAPNLYSWNKIITLTNEQLKKVYLISIIALEKDQQKFELEVETIFNSIQLENNSS